jgi:hypothetical protein
MRKTKFAMAVAALALVGALGATSAGAATKAEPTAQVVGKVKLNKDGTATVKAHYICPNAEDWHLWVSAKQAEDGSRDEDITQEGGGFGGIPASWLQSHPVSFTCDGKWHTQKFEINKEEVGYGALIAGEAWVQFCLINEGEGLFLIDQLWTKVR